MSPPCRVDRMSTKLSDFSLICSLALFLYVYRFLVALVASFHFPIAILRLLSSFWYEPLSCPSLPFSLFLPPEGLTDVTILIIAKLVLLCDFALSVSHG